MKPEAIKSFHLTRNFGKRTAVDGIDLTVRQSELFSLLGLNGAGKTAGQSQGWEEDP